VVREPRAAAPARPLSRAAHALAGARAQPGYARRAARGARSAARGGRGETHQRVRVEGLDGAVLWEIASHLSQREQRDLVRFLIPPHGWRAAPAVARLQETGMRQHSSWSVYIFFSI